MHTQCTRPGRFSRRSGNRDAIAITRYCLIVGFTYCTLQGASVFGVRWGLGVRRGPDAQRPTRRAPRPRPFTGSLAVGAGGAAGSGRAAADPPGPQAPPIHRFAHIEGRDWLLLAGEWVVMVVADSPLSRRNAAYAANWQPPALHTLMCVGGWGSAAFKTQRGLCGGPPGPSGNRVRNRGWACLVRFLELGLLITKNGCHPIVF